MSWTTDGDGPRTSDRLTGLEAAELSGRIADLARAGLPMASSLQAMAEELPRGRLRRSVERLATRLEMGVSLADAVQGEGGRVPAHLRALVLAAAPRQMLGEMLAEFSRYVEAGRDRRRRAWLALMYPLALLAIELAVLMGISLVLTPQFESIFRAFGIPLPWLTVLLVAVSLSVARLGPPLLTLATLLAATALLTRLLLGKAWLTALLARVPIVGGVWRWTSLAEYYHLLGLLLENQVPMSEALRLTSEDARHAGLSAASRRMAAAVEAGQPFALAMAASPQFPAGLPRLLHWGERQGSLPDALHMAGELCDARADAQAKAVRSFLMALSIALMIGCAFLLCVGLMLPLIFLISKFA